MVGIAGPGDAFANPEQTLETLRLIEETRREWEETHPDEAGPEADEEQDGIE